MKTSLWFSWLTLVIAAASLCFAGFRCEPIEADWAAVLVCILAALVTALIGWQIYNVVDFKTTSKKLDYAIKLATNLNLEHKNFIIYVDAEGYSNNADSLYILKCYVDAIEQYIKALQMYSKIETYEQRERYIKLGIYVCIANWASCLGNVGQSASDDRKTYERIITILQSNRPYFKSLISVNDDIKDLFDIMRTNMTDNSHFNSDQIEYITEIYNRNREFADNLLLECNPL